MKLTAKYKRHYSQYSVVYRKFGEHGCNYCSQHPIQCKDVPDYLPTPVVQSNLSQKYTQPQKIAAKGFFAGFVFYYMSFVTLQKFTKICPWEKVKFMANPKWRKLAMKCMNNHYISTIGYFSGIQMTFEY